MKTDIKKKIKAIIAEHKVARDAANAPYAQQIGDLIKSNIYTEEYKQQQIDGIKPKIMANNVNYDAQANQYIRAALAEARSELIPAPTKPADYSIQINNALAFIKAAGKNLTDDKATKILKPFQADVETMNLFKDVINNQGCITLTNPFAKTFAETDKMVALINNFKNVEDLADKIINSNDSSIGQAICYKSFLENVDGIQENAEKIEGTN